MPGCAFNVQVYSSSDKRGFKFEMGKRDSDSHRDPQGVHKEKNGDANNPYAPEAVGRSRSLASDIRNRTQQNRLGVYETFPSKKDMTKHFPRRMVDHELCTVCGKLGLEGVSTHSFRRSALTAASSKGVPLRVIQSISGHSSLDILQRYLSVTDNQKKEAALAFD